ncbi:MAG: hypothetical protein WC755_02010 [Candidatus Woesearchaeota archaeon]|jgi:hypothetical protein
MSLEGFFIVGRFPLGIKCSIDANSVIIFENEVVKINSELDSPIFLYKNKDGLFIQLASQTNGSKILIHEEFVEFFDESDKAVELKDIKIEQINPIGEK